MSEYIDAKGLGCAEPVLLARRSLKSHDEVTVVVDTRTSVENIKALAAYTGFAIEIVEKPGGTYLVVLRRKPGNDAWSSGNGSNGSGRGGS